MKENNNNHIVQLDGLRFFAVLMVMIAHWMQWQWTSPVLTNFPFVHGVILFFVLSGFLITGILLRYRDKDIQLGLKHGPLIKNFYIRRFLRIFPIYYLTLFFLFAIDYKNTREVFPWLVSYTSNIYQSIHNVYIGDFNHFWSLGVEEQFYLFWPWIILFIPSKKTFRAIIITIIIALMIKSYLYFFVGKWMATAYFTLSCMHALGLGALLAYLSIYKKQFLEKLARPIWLYLGIALYLFLLVVNYRLKMGWYKEIVDEFFFALVAALIILRASRDGFRFAGKYILENPFVVYSGKISYGLYVYHLFMPALFYYLSARIGLSISNKYTLFVAFYFLSFAVSHLSWLLIEKPINRLKSKVPYIKKQVQTV